MDILKPQIVKIGTRRYRKNPLNDKSENWGEKPLEEDLLEPGEAECHYDDSVSLDDLDIRQTDSGFKLLLSVPSAYYKFLIGKKGETRKRIEVETKTRIRIPNIGEDADIVISGNTKSNVASAKIRMELIVTNQRRWQPFTHFLAFPLNNEVIQFNFGEFKVDVLRECHGDRGLDETIFQNPLKMHLTLGTLVLLNQAEIDEASALLKSCYDEFIKPMVGKGCIRVVVRGLEYMNDDPSEVDVLYAKVFSLDKDDLLETLSQRIVERFIAAGIMDREYDRVKIHLTVMNTLIRKDPSSGALLPMAERRHMKDRESFDATRILQKFGNYNFHECTIGSIDICQRHGTRCDGYYTKVLSLPFD